MNDELVRFVREALASGVSKPEIRSTLSAAGWPEDEVGSALAAFADLDFPIPVPRPKPYLSAREAFLYLALFATLYTSAVSFGSLVYEFIDRLLPDPAVRRVAFDDLTAVRWATASLIIAFPVFLLLSRTMYRAIRRDPVKRTSKIRKWLTYLTLLVAAAVLIGDLITLVFNLLGGELTLRFLLKVLTVGGIAGSVFGYYLWDLRQDDLAPERWAARHPGVRLFAGTVVALVGAAIIGGLLLAGSPQRARLARLDDRRVADLQEISRAIDRYWSQSRGLPADLEELSRQRGVRIESVYDPETGELYEYRTTGETTYELCAVFDAEDELSARGDTREPWATGERFWSHAAGRVCFPVEVRAPQRVVIEPEPGAAERGPLPKAPEPPEAAEPPDGDR